jgi:hypothetical protein
MDVLRCGSYHEVVPRIAAGVIAGEDTAELFLTKETPRLSLVGLRSGQGNSLRRTY